MAISSTIEIPLEDQIFRKSHVEHPPSKTRRKRLLCYPELPSWQHGNEYLLSGYRPATGSMKGSLESMLSLNNETVNVYSHLLGAVLFSAMLARCYGLWAWPYADGDRTFALVLGIYLLGVAICFALSAMCHVLWNHSAQCSAYWRQLDYLGIVALMYGAGVPTIYLGFYCDPHLQRFYWLMNTIIAAACASFTMNPRFGVPKFRPYRTMAFAGLGMTGVVFVIHGLLLHGWDVQGNRMGLVWMAKMTGLNAVGAAFYAVRIPERWYPYRFDYFGHSHQIFHVMVLLAALAHVAGLLTAYQSISDGWGVCY